MRELRDIVAAYDDVREWGEAGVLASVIQASGSAYRRAGARMLVRPTGSSVGLVGGGCLEGDLAERARERRSDGRMTCTSGRVPPALAAAMRSEKSRLGGDYLVEFVPPPIRLAIFGAGADAEPLAAAALALGWEVVVTDHRPVYAKPERFVGARVVLADAESASHIVRVDARTHAVVMTHNFLLDADLLRRLLESRPAYIAVLGPKQRTEDLLEELRSEDIAPSAASLYAIFAPAGLDLGAEAPEEIALSIVSETLAVSHSWTFV